MERILAVDSEYIEDIWTLFPPPFFPGLIIKIEIFEWLNICISCLCFPIPSKLLCIRIYLLGKTLDLGPVMALDKQGGEGEEQAFASSW